MNKLNGYLLDPFTSNITQVKLPQLGNAHIKQIIDPDMNILSLRGHPLPYNLTDMLYSGEVYKEGFPKERHHFVRVAGIDKPIFGRVVIIGTKGELIATKGDGFTDVRVQPDTLPHLIGWVAHLNNSGSAMLEFRATLEGTNKEKEEM